MILRTTFFFIIFNVLPYAIANFRLHLLHNNDMHARFEETEENPYNWTCKSTECFGGFARVKQAAKQFTKDADRRDMPTLFLNAGDTFQGTPYYTLKKWTIVAPLVNAIGFHATCLGNHEFDNGIDNLVEYLNHLQTPVVACNLNTTTEKRLEIPNLQPSVVITVGAERIGIVGYLTPSTMESSNAENLQILDEIPCIRKEARRLKSNGIKIIIALGHSGVERDKEIAQQVEEISLIVGGHSHTMMYSPKETPPSIETALESYPLFVTQKSGKQVPIVQAYAYTKYMGRLFLEFDHTGAVISAEGNPVLLNSSIPKDPLVNTLVESWTNPLKDILKTVKGYLRVPLLRPDVSSLEFESNAGNLVTDALLHYGVKHAKESNTTSWTNAPITIYNRGGIRADLFGESDGAVTLGDLYTLTPFQNQIYEVTLLGSTLLKALEYTVTKDDSNSYSILDFSGLRVEYNLGKPVGRRVSSVFVMCKACSVPRYEKLKPSEKYTVLMPNFLLHGRSNFGMFRNESLEAAKINKTDTDAVIEYIEQLQLIYPKLEGRLTITETREDDSGFDMFSFIIIFIVCGALAMLFYYVYKSYCNLNYQYQRLDL